MFRISNNQECFNVRESTYPQVKIYNLGDSWPQNIISGFDSHDARACAKLFLDYYLKDRNAFLHIFSQSISQLNQDSGEANQASKLFDQTTLENDPLQLNFLEIDTVLDSFMMQYILPNSLYYLQDKIDIFQLFRPNAVLSTSTSTSPQTKSASSIANNNNSMMIQQENQNSSQNSQQQQSNNFHQMCYRFYLLDQIHFFLEKLFRKSMKESSTQLTFGRLQNELLHNINWNQVQEEMGPQHSRRAHYNYLACCKSYEDLLLDQQIISHKLLRRTKKAFFFYLQNKETGFAMLENFENTIDRQSVSTAFTLILQNQQSCYQISAMLQNFFDLLENSTSTVMALKFAVMLLRCFDVLLKDMRDTSTVATTTASTAANAAISAIYTNQNQGGKQPRNSIPTTATTNNNNNNQVNNKYLVASSLSCLLKGLLWKTVRTVLYIHKGLVSQIVLSYLIRNAQVIFTGDKQMGFYAEIENYMYMIYSFLYIYNGGNEFISGVNLIINKSQILAKDLLFKLHDMKGEPDQAFLLSHRFLELSYGHSGVNNKINEMFSHLYTHQSTSTIPQQQQQQQQQQQPIQTKGFSRQQQGQAANLQPQFNQQVLVDFLTYKVQAIEWLASDQIDFKRMLPEQSVLVLAYIRRLMLTEYLQSPDLLSSKKIGQSRQFFSKLFQKLLQMPALQDWQNFSQQNFNCGNTLIMVKAKLLVECFGLIGAMPQDFLSKKMSQSENSHNSFQGILSSKGSSFAGNSSSKNSSSQSISSSQQSLYGGSTQVNNYEQFQRGDTPQEILDKMKNFLNSNLLSLDIPFNAICSCYENLESIKSKSSNNQNVALNAQSRQNLDITKNDLLLQFNFTDFLVYLAQIALQLESKTLQEYQIVINSSLDLMNCSDFAIMITPWLIHKILSSDTQKDLQNAVNDISEILQHIIKKGHIFHKFIISQSLKILDYWLIQAQNYVPNISKYYDSDKKNYNIPHNKHQQLEQEKEGNKIFIKYYSSVLDKLDVLDKCEMYIMLSEYSQAIYLLEKYLYLQQSFQPENLMDPVKKSQCSKIVRDLYKYYCFVNEDYKNLDGAALLRRLDLDPAVIQDMEQESRTAQELLPQLLQNAEECFEPNHKNSTANADRIMFNNLCSGPPLLINKNSNEIFLLLRCICWAVHCYKEYDFNKQIQFSVQIQRAFHNLKKGLAVHVINGQALYEAKFHYFVGIQATIALELQFSFYSFLYKFEITRFSNDKAKKESLKIYKNYSNGQYPSLDSAEPNFIKYYSIYLEQYNDKGVMPLSQLLQDFVANCLKTQLKMLDLFEQNYEQSHYLRVIYKYQAYQFNRIRKIHDHFEYFYLESLYILAQFNFKNKNYKAAQANLMCIRQSEKFQQKTEIKKLYWLLKAQIQKKLFNYIKAIHILEKIKGDKNDLLYQEARQKLVTYFSKCQQYSIKDVKERFKLILQKEDIKSETIYFKYAKYLDDTYPQPNLNQYYLILQNYMQSVLLGRKYIYHSLPRMIHLWLDVMHNKDQNICKNENDRDIIKKIHFLMEQNLCSHQSKIQDYKLVLIIQQLISQIEHPDKPTVEKVIVPTLARIAAKYPYQSVWWLLPLKFFEIDSQSQTLKQDRAKQILEQVNKLNQRSYKLITQSELFYSKLLDLGKGRTQDNSSTLHDDFLLQRQVVDILLPVRDQLTPYLPTLNNKKDKHKYNFFNFYENQQIQQAGLPPRANSKANLQGKQQQQQKQGEAMIMNDSEQFGCADDLDTQYNPYSPWNNQQIMLIVQIMPHFKVMHTKERPKKIDIKYKYINEQLQECYGIKSFLLKSEPTSDVRKEQRTSEFCNFLNNLLDGFTFAKERNITMQTYAIIPLNNHVSLVEWVEDTTTIKSIIDKLWVEKKIKGSMHEINQLFSVQQKKYQSNVWKIIKDYPNVFQEYFFNQFKYSSNWIKAIQQYQITLAVWSCFCYIIGLGDRHCDNILIVQNSGIVLHIDFDCIFEKGKFLPVPEIMPFRLTKNLEQALGAFQSQGLFRYYMIELCKFFAKNQGNIMVALESFISDPLLQKTVQFDKDMGISRIKDNVSFSKFPCIEEGVERLIQQCKDPAGLREMYIGWMPHM